MDLYLHPDQVREMIKTAEIESLIAKGYQI